MTWEGLPSWTHQVGRFLARFEIGHAVKGGEFTSALSSDRMTAELSGLAVDAAPACKQEQEAKALREIKLNIGRIVARAVGVAPMALPLASCSEGVLDPHGPIGRAERIILYNATAIMLAVVVPVILLTVAFAWWFRAGNKRAKYRPDWEYSGRIEMIVWSIPALVVLFLGGIAWIGSHDLDPPKPIASAVPPLDVEVVSLDWKWLFIYPTEGVASINRLVVPIGTPIRFRLTSASVMNSFFVPQLGSQIYTMAGMTTRLNLQADHAAVYKGLSAQFSGEGFSDMRFDLVAVPADQFQGWVNTAKMGGGTLDAAAFAALTRPSKADKPATYAGVAPGLFETVSSGHAEADLLPHQEH
jgi:cytochrome o ubiquinol oxidase subunit 2